MMCQVMNIKCFFVGFCVTTYLCIFAAMRKLENRLSTYRYIACSDVSAQSTAFILDEEAQISYAED